MKAIIFVFVVLLSLPTNLLGATDSPDSVFSAANTLYNQKEYAKATGLYQQLLAQGYRSEEVYYNLGNTLYRSNDLARAIWCYEKCLLIDPAHRDARSNLSLVNRQLLGDQEVVPENFFVYFWKSMHAMMPFRWWARVFVIFMAGFLALGLLFLLSTATLRRRILFAASIVFLLLTFLSLAQSVYGYFRMKNPGFGIVVNNGVALRSAPDGEGTNVMILLPGSKVSLLDEKNMWIKVAAPDGTLGWIPQGSVLSLAADSPVVAD